MSQYSDPRQTPPDPDASVLGAANAPASTSQADQPAGRVGTQARRVADTARGDAARVGEEAKQQTRNVVAETRGQLREQARQQTDRAATVLQGLGDNVRAIAEGRKEDSGAVGDYVDQLADRLEELAGRVNELGFDGMVDELQRFARRRPGAFLLGAAVSGFALGRLLRGARDASSAPTASPSVGEVSPRPEMREPIVVTPASQPPTAPDLDVAGPASAGRTPRADERVYRVEER